MTQFRNYIAGEWVSSPCIFDNINPVSGALIGHVHEASAEDVNSAVTAARAALSGEWGRMSVTQRCNMLRRVAERMTERIDDFLAAEIVDTGKPLLQAKTVDIPRGAANFASFAELATSYPDEAYHMQAPDGGMAVNYSLRRPLGVVGVIAPWNLPLLLLTWKVAPALAAGNVVLAKPSEETPGTATLLAEVMDEVGMPKGVFNLLHGFGMNSAGAFIVEHPGVDAITFTGESTTGVKIMHSAAPRVKPVSFELGGKNAAIVFEDSDLEAALDGVARAVFLNCGQVCMCTERVFVARSIFERFVAGMKSRAEALVLGDPFDDGTTTGPLISAKHRDKVLRYYRLAESAGATVITGGASANDLPPNGFFVTPTIWTGLGDDARINREEIFGPCCHISVFDAEDEVIARANQTDYGLCASIWTRDIARGHRVAHQMDVGITWVNSWYLRDLRTPFGGTKLSGIGREGGLHSLNFYAQPSNICIQY